jgi:hypothetical protein
MNSNQNTPQKEAKKISDLVTKEIFKNYKDMQKREITYQEAMDDVEYMVQINQLIQIMIERRNERIIS